MKPLKTKLEEGLKLKKEYGQVYDVVKKLEGLLSLSEVIPFNSEEQEGLRRNLDKAKAKRKSLMKEIEDSRIDFSQYIKSVTIGESRSEWGRPTFEVRFDTPSIDYASIKPGSLNFLSIKPITGLQVMHFKFSETSELRLYISVLFYKDLLKFAPDLETLVGVRIEEAIASLKVEEGNKRLTSYGRKSLDTLEWASNELKRKINGKR